MTAGRSLRPSAHAVLTLSVAGLMIGSVSLAIAAPTEATPAIDLRYVDFPARVDPQGLRKHIPLLVGSRVYFRQNVRVREISTDASGRSVEATQAVDAASSITRLPHETKVVEPDGTVLHFSANAVIDRSDEARNYSIVVVPPGKAVPQYLRMIKPDIEVR